jgi:hypothetical protein
MKLSAPKMVTFIVGVALGVIALLFQFVPAIGAGQYAFVVAILSIAVLVLGNIVKGL